MEVKGRHYRTVWMGGSVVKMVNQLLLPHSFEIIELKDYKETANAISTMVVRGAGAIGAAAGFGVAQGALANEDLEKVVEIVKNTRPTAQDLFYAVGEVKKASAKGAEEAVKKANELADANANAGEKIGEYGNGLIKDGMKVLTHCNAGWLAFVDWGSALAPIYKAKRAGKKVFVWVDETRPRMQGARLTAWELANEGVRHGIIADNAAGYFMQKGEVDLVIVGADRIAGNGDVANKIGTYEKAVLAKENNVPFYVAAPLSTFDLKINSGEEIPIEERNEDEVKSMWGRKEKGDIGKLLVANESSNARNPAFDVTPAKYVSGIITEKGIIKAKGEEIAKLFS